MRLVGKIEEEKAAFAFQAFLASHKLQSIYELARDKSGHIAGYNIWIIEEDDYDRALAYLEEFRQNPSDPRFARPKEPPPPPPRLTPLKDQAWKVRPTPTLRKRQQITWTGFFVWVCIFVFMIDSMQQSRILSSRGEAAFFLERTPIQQHLLFDYPKIFDNFRKFLEEHPVKTLEEIKTLPSQDQAAFHAAETTPTWDGALPLLLDKSLKSYEALPDGTLFHDIRQGQLWRLLSPVFLHANFWHILFNMLALWVLGKPIEARVGKGRFLLLTLFLGIISNVAQYLMSGPMFLGFSGIDVGFAGFIWVRQKKAPWEGYPLPRSSLMSIAIFVIAMLGIDIALVSLKYFQIFDLGINIANTAHIVGGLLGIFSACLPFFARRNASS